MSALRGDDGPAEMVRYLDRDRIQHLWECEACGHKFKTLVSLSHSQSDSVPVVSERRFLEFARKDGSS